MSIRSFLLKVFSLSLLPLLGLVGYLTISQLMSIQEVALRDGERLVQNLATALDRDLEGRISALKALSLLSALDAPIDRQGFYNRAVMFSGEFGGAVVLLDHTGQQIVNTRAPFDVPLPKTNHWQTIGEVFKTGKPVVSNAILGTVANTLLIGIYVPVVRDGEVRFALGQTWEPKSFQALLEQQAWPDEWRSGIIDGRGKFIARSHGFETLVGKPAAAPLVEAAAASYRGRVSNLSVEGIPFQNFYHHSDVANWFVAVGVPEAVMNTAVERAAWLLGLTLLLVAGATAIGLYFGGRRIADGISALASSPGQAPPTGLREIDAGLDTLRTSLAVREQALFQAEEASNSKSRFMAAASHDLRQPIQALRLFHGVLLTKQVGETEASVCSLMDSALQAAERLLNGILDVSKIEAGVIPVSPELIPVSEVFKDLAMSAVPTENGAEVRFVSTSQVITADRVAITRILSNLISNAVKHGGGSVLVGCRRDPAGVRIEVVDQGSGIPDGEGARIFEEFYQVGNEARSNANGHGLGLSIAMKLAHRCGFDLGFRNRRRGCVFYLRIPVPPATSEHGGG